VGRNLYPNDNYGMIDVDVDMSADAEGAALDIGTYDEVLLTAQWNGLDVADGQFAVEISDTGLVGSWTPYPESEWIVDGLMGTQHWILPSVSAISFIRFTWTAGTNSSGTFSTSYRRVAKQ
jgi:hypothetical protein